MIDFDTSFFYEPSHGSLLLDVRNFGGGQGQTEYFDGSLRTDDSISDVRAYSGDGTGDVNSLSGHRTTGGLVTLFEFTAVPALAVSIESNNLVFRWGTQWNGCVLQQSSCLGPSTNWQPDGGRVTTNGSYLETSLPLDTRMAGEFFRLASPPSSGAGPP